MLCRLIQRLLGSIMFQCALLGCTLKGPLVNREDRKEMKEKWRENIFSRCLVGGRRGKKIGGCSSSKWGKN